LPRAVAVADFPVRLQDLQAVRGLAGARICVGLDVLNFRRPSDGKAPLNALVHRTVALVDFERAVGFSALSGRDLELVPQLDGRDANEFFLRFNAARDFGLQMVSGGDSARFQRAGQSAGQSTGECRKQVVNRRRQWFRRLNSVKRPIATMHAKAQRLRKAFDVGLPQRPLFLHNANSCCVHDLAHMTLPNKKRCCVPDPS
jgi:hypothetical protein